MVTGASKRRATVSACAAGPETDMVPQETHVPLLLSVAVVACLTARGEIEEVSLKTAWGPNCPGMAKTSMMTFWMSGLGGISLVFFVPWGIKMVSV